MPHHRVTAGRGRRLLAGLVALAALTAIVGAVPPVLLAAWRTSARRYPA